MRRRHRCGEGGPCTWLAPAVAHPAWRSRALAGVGCGWRRTVWAWWRVVVWLPRGALLHFALYAYRYWGACPAPWYLAPVPVRHHRMAGGQAAGALHEHPLGLETRDHQSDAGRLTRPLDVVERATCGAHRAIGFGTLAAPLAQLAYDNHRNLPTLH